MKCCPNCGIGLEGRSLGDIPIEEQVSDEIRTQQYQMALSGFMSKHSITLVVADQRRAGFTQ
jgi:hypothetical protein